MKVKHLPMVLSAIFVTTLSFTAHADEQTTGWFVDLGAAAVQFDDDRQADADAGAYAGLGYQFSDNWSLGLRYHSTDFELDAQPGVELDFDLYDLEAVYRHNPRNENSLFWKFGAGKLKFNGVKQSGTNIFAGVGYAIAMSEKSAFQFGVDWTHHDDSNMTDTIPYLGISYFLGGQGQSKPEPKPVVAPKPKDSDRDGVIDEMDMCPNTQPNYPVDKAGCALDGDKDGVKDPVDACPNTPLGAKVDDKGCRVYLTEEVSITLDVKFANNSDVIDPRFDDEIKRVADFMREYPDTTAEIIGHTDSRGKDWYNQALSQRRANAVKQYLIAKFNVDPARLTAIGKGEAEPIADNNTAEGRAKNRRVVAVIKTTVKKPQ